MDELVDIVDSDNVVTGSTTKREAHEKGLLHRTAIGEIRDSRGNWLLVKQSSKRQDAGQYVSPVGGHVKAGESEEDALKREASEEVGFDGDFKFEFVGRAIFDRKVIGRHENHFFIVYKITSDAIPVLNHESESYRSFTEAELKQEIKTHPELFGGAFIFVLQTFYPAMLE